MSEWVDNDEGLAPRRMPWRQRRKWRRYNRIIREAEESWDTRPKLFSMRYGKGPDAQRRAYILGYTDAKGMPK